MIFKKIKDWIKDDETHASLEDALRMHRMAHQDLCETIGHYHQINRRKLRRNKGKDNG